MTRPLIATLAAFYCALAMADPVSEFKEIVVRCKDEFALQPETETKYSANRRAWIKWIRTPVEVSYDVRKTDSLVAPLSGYIEVVEVYSRKSSDDEQTAKSLEVSLNEDAVRNVTRIDFINKDGRWEFSSATFSGQIRRSPSFPFDRARWIARSRAELIKSESPIVACVL